MSPKRRAVSYIAVGSINTAGYFAVYNALRLVLPPLTANSLSVAAAITFRFGGNRRYTFETRGRHRLARQFSAFCSMFIATLLLSNAALLVLFELQQQPDIWLENFALVVSSAALMGVRYLFMRRIFDDAGSRQRARDSLPS